MTASVLLFDAYAPDDDALRSSHWMAERTKDQLGDDAALLTYPDAVRANLEAHLGATTLHGIAVFGHGDAGRLHTTLRVQHRDDIQTALAETSEAGAIYGCDTEPALDLANIHLLRGRWCHALACNIGLSLAHRAIQPGASCFVAYETSLTPEYETDTLPPPLVTRLAALVTTTTLSLHAGLREEAALKARVQEASDHLEVWLDSEEGLDWIARQDNFMQVAGLRGLARQLWREMVVVVAAGAADVGGGPTARVAPASHV